MTYRKINMNDPVLIQLTDYGREVAIKALTVGPFKGEESLDMLYPEQADGYRKFQLWEVMSIFGPSIGMGRENPFKMNILWREP